MGADAAPLSVTHTGRLLFPMNSLQSLATPKPPRQASIWRPGSGARVSLVTLLSTQVHVTVCLPHRQAYQPALGPIPVLSSSPRHVPCSLSSVPCSLSSGPCSLSSGRLVGGLASENVRWAESVENFKSQGITLCGDVLLISAFVSYVGYFTKKYRNELMEKFWIPYINKLKVRGTAVVMTQGDMQPHWGSVNLICWD